MLVSQIHRAELGAKAIDGYAAALQTSPPEVNYFSR
jgi:hypothetical protein